MYLAEAALDHMSWSGAAAFKYDDMARATIASVERAPLAHVGPHLLLLQGLIPDSVLDNSQTSFIGPAWSLSLEWQFYLIAPALVWLISRRAWAAATIAALALGAALYRLGAFGAFELPSIFPAIGYLFALGIASRLVFPVLQRAQFFPVALAFGCLIVALLYREFFAMALWGAFLSIIAGQPKAPHERLASRVVNAATQSPLAVAMGARSYAVYLAHWPVIQALAYLLFPLAPFTQWQALLVLGPCAVVATLLSAELLHRFVEKPMIRLGAQIASRPRRTPVAAAASEAS
jgi:peptidoglycan/LPS O-acetylase OafA/YrhL